jgi:hypothetical protein
LQDGRVVTEIERLAAGGDHQDPMPASDLGSEDLDSVEQKREFARKGIPVHFDGEALIECLGPKALGGDEFRDPPAIFGTKGSQLALSDHALEDWRGSRFDFLKPVLEGYGFALNLEVVEAFLGCGLPRRGLGYPVGANVEAEYATIAVGEILDEEFWHPVLVFI